MKKELWILDFGNGAISLSLNYFQLLEKIRQNHTVTSCMKHFRPAKFLFILYYRHLLQKMAYLCEIFCNSV